MPDPTERRRCGAKLRGKTRTCRRWPRKGQQRCGLHGGASPQAEAAAQRRQEHDQAQQAVRTYGLPVDVAPEDALLEEVHRTAGHVAYLNQLVGDLDRKGLKQYAAGEGGALWERPSVWVELYRHERAHLVSVCKAAISAGIEERRVQLAEKQGELVAELLRVAIDAAQLSPQQSARAYEAIRGHLTRVA